MELASCDLLAANLLVRNGRLAAVLDFGGLAVGDPTVDLVAEWVLGRSWALAIAVITIAYYWRSMPERCAGRFDPAQQVLMDAGLG